MGIKTGHCSENAIVDRTIGTAYDVVRAVYDALDDIKLVADHLELERGVKGDDGDYPTFAFQVSSGLPSKPDINDGSYDGTNETFPSGWTAAPESVLEANEYLYVIKRVYRSEGDTWINEEWSEPALFAARGVQGDKPIEGEDYFTADGAFNSFVYKVSKTKPTTPTGGSFDGVNEVPPTGWTDDPVETNVEGEANWVSKNRYVQNAETKEWSLAGSWSEPVIGFKEGEKPKFGTDYTTVDGAFKSFIYKNSASQPAIPTGGSWDGTNEVVPTGWTDDPQATSGNEITWVSVNLYKHDGTNWTSPTWSEPSKFFQKGDKGNVPEPGVDYFTQDGSFKSFVFHNSPNKPSAPIGGAYDGENETMPEPLGDWTNDPVEVVGSDITWVSTTLWVHDKETDTWSNNGWDDPTKWFQKGDKPEYGVDYTTKDGDFISFIYQNNANEPDVPTGGTYDGTNETYPTGWADNPTIATGNEITWVCQTKWVHNPDADTWSHAGWSNPSKFYERGQDGDAGARGSNSYYVPTSGSVWSDSVAEAGITAAGDIPQQLDTVTLYNTSTGFSETRYLASLSPNDWQKVEQVIDGNLIVHGTVGADQISVINLEAISATMGTLFGGTIYGSVIKTVPSSAPDPSDPSILRVEMNTSNIPFFIGTTDNKRLSFNTETDELILNDVTLTGTGIIDKKSLFSDELWDTMFPPIVDATGGNDAVSPLPHKMELDSGTRSVNILTINNAGTNPVLVEIAFDDGGGTIDSPTPTNYTNPEWDFTVERRVNGGGWAAVYSQRHVGTSFNAESEDSPPGQTYYDGNYNIDVNISFSDTPPTTEGDTLEYRVTVHHATGSYTTNAALYAELTNCSISQAYQGGSGAVHWDDITNKPATLVYSNQVNTFTASQNIHGDGRLYINDDDAAGTTDGTPYIGFRFSGSQLGYVGYGSNGSSDLMLVNASGAVRLTNSGNNSTFIYTANGYGSFGAANSSWFHMATDRASFHTNKPIHATSRVQIYGTGVFMDGAGFNDGGAGINNLTTINANNVDFQGNSGWLIHDDVGALVMKDISNITFGSSGRNTNVILAAASGRKAYVNIGGVQNEILTAGSYGLTLVYRGELVGGIDLNTLTTAGYWHQNSNAEAGSGSNYPSAHAGMLEVLDFGTYTYQRYSLYDGSKVFYRTYYQSWSAWIRLDANAKAADSDLLDGLDSSAFGQMATLNTWTQQDVFNIGLLSKGWIRTEGAFGWYSNTYAGGIYMNDTSYVKVYNNKKFRVYSTSSDSIRTAGGILATGRVEAGSFKSGSARFKKEIEQVDERETSLKFIDALGKLGVFVGNYLPQYGDPTETHRWWIAEDVNKVMRRLGIKGDIVGLNKNGDISTLNYIETIPDIAASISCMLERITELEKKVNG